MSRIYLCQRLFAMGYRFTAALALILSLTMTNTQATPSIESTPAPRPKVPNFSPFEFLIGSWSCTDRETNRPGPSPSTETWAMDNTHYWITATGAASAVKWFPYALKTQQRITYDSDAKLWVYLYWDDLGGYGLSTSPGWNSGALVWTSRSFFPTKDVTAVSKFIIKKVSDRKYTGTYSFTNAKATVIGGQVLCLKI